MSQYLNWLQAQIQNRQPTQIEMMNRNLNEIAVVHSKPKGFGSGLPNKDLIAAAAKITAENRDKEKGPKKLEEGEEPKKKLEEGEARFSRLIGAKRKAERHLNRFQNRADALARGSVPRGPDGQQDPSKLNVAREKVMGGPVGTEIRGLEAKAEGVKAAANRAGDKWLRRVASGTGLTIDSTKGTTEPPLTRFPTTSHRVNTSVDYLRNNRNIIDLRQAEPANTGEINTAPYLRSLGGYHATRIAADLVNLVKQGRNIDGVAAALPNVPRQGIRRIMRNIHTPKPLPKMN